MFEFVGQFGVVQQELFGVFTALSQLDLAVVEPRAAFVGDAALDGQIEQVADRADAAVEHNIKLGGLERCGHLVFDHAGTNAVADGLLAAGNRLNPPHIHPHRGVKLQCVTAGGRFGVAEHHTDLHSNLVDKDQAGLALADGAGEFSQCLAHQPCLEADMALAHLALKLRGRHKRGHRIDHDNIDGVGLDQHLGDIQRLLAGVRLTDQQAADIDAKLLGPRRIQRVFGIDKGRHAAKPLGAGDGVQGQRGLAGRLRPVKLHHAPARNARPAQCDIQ